jgi:hypothetical protein
MRVLIEDTCFAPANAYVKLVNIVWLLGIKPRDLWIRVKYSAEGALTIWGCATRDDAIEMPVPTTFLASANTVASPDPRSVVLLTAGAEEFCAVQGTQQAAVGLPDVLWAYLGDPVTDAILDKAAATLRTYAYPGAALGGIQPRDITTGPGADYVASLPAVELEALAPIDELGLHDGNALQSRRFRVSVRTPGPESSAWRSAIDYSRAIMSILADEHRRNIPAGILCRYVGGEGPVPDGPSEGGQKCTMIFEVVGIEARPDGPLTVA